MKMPTISYNAASARCARLRDKMAKVQTNGRGGVVLNPGAMRLWWIAATSFLIVLSSTFVHAQSNSNENTRSFGATFLMAYLPNAQIPIRPYELPVRRWKAPLKIFFDERLAPIGIRQHLLERFHLILDFVQANTNLNINEVHSESDANIWIAFTNSNEIDGSISIDHLLKKYYGSWLGGLASDLSDFKKQTCIANSAANQFGEIQAAIVLVHPDIPAVQSERCIANGIMHAIGFDGALPVDAGNSLFSSVPDQIEIGPEDALILQRLYGDQKAPNPLSLSDFIMQINPIPSVTP